MDFPGLITLSALIILRNTFFTFLIFFFLNVDIQGQKKVINFKSDSALKYDFDVLRNLSIEQLLPEDMSVTRLLLDVEMPKLRASELGKILSRYYYRCLGGERYWETIKSIKVSGDLNTRNGVYEYESVIKKPNLYKISLSTFKSTNIIVSDGNEIRQKLILKDSNITKELFSKDDKLDRIINEIELHRYLLYPFQEDKAFQYLGTVREFNTICFKIRLFTAKNFIIDYFIDTESYLITAIMVKDVLNVFSPATIQYSKYRQVGSAFFAHEIKSYLNGIWDSTLNLRVITPNIGVPNWLFYSRDDSFKTSIK